MAAQCGHSCSQMRKTIILLLCVTLILAACPLVSGEQTVFLPVFGQAFVFDGEKVREGKEDVARGDVTGLALPFSLDAPKAGVHHRLAVGTDAETPVYLVDSGKEGPTVYLAAGTHGDEIAGWYLAEHLPALHLKSGRLFILPQVNRPGCEAKRRTIIGSLDVNRAYPGRPDGDLAQKVAHQVYQDIEAIRPVLVLDLHEAAYYSTKREFLGNMLIFTALDGAEELFMQLLLASEQKKLGSFPFGFVSPGVQGSLNQTVAEGLGIPVLTVETFRGFPLSSRIADQATIIYFCLKQMDMM